MNIEVRKRNGKKLYYLAYSFRVGDKVRKVRKYLGADLKRNDLEAARKKYETELLKKIEEEKKISDPLRTMLSEKDLKILNGLISTVDFDVLHLTEKEWRIFTEHFTYDTNAIEGSTITENEVREIIEENKWPGGKSRSEISETYGVAKAITHIRKTKKHISTELIKELHKIVFQNSKSFAGKFREKGVDVVIKDSDGLVVHRGTASERIVKELNALIRWYNKNKANYHPLVLAAVIHNQFENIHPFQDGNGRVGRLLLNNILLKHKLSPVNIELKNRQQYYRSLQAYENRQDLRPTIELILKEYKHVTTQGR